MTNVMEATEPTAVKGGLKRRREEEEDFEGSKRGGSLEVERGRGNTPMSLIRS